MADAVDDAIAAVGARNDLYVKDLVEAHGVCPFAQPCREQGRLWRAISWLGTKGDWTRLLPLAEQLEALEAPVEVALLLLPGLRHTPTQHIDRVHQQFRDAYNSREGGVSYYVVPFHPSYPCNNSNPNSLVRYWRRSPDPCLQFVDIKTLNAVRHTNPRDEQSRVALRMLAQGQSAEDVLDSLRALRLRQGTSQRIAEQNFERFSEVGRSRFDSAIAKARSVALPPLNDDWQDVTWQRAQ